MYECRENNRCTRLTAYVGARLKNGVKIGSDAVFKRSEVYGNTNGDQVLLSSFPPCLCEWCIVQSYDKIDK
jgi:hypothetical protein